MEEYGHILLFGYVGPNVDGRQICNVLTWTDWEYRAYVAVDRAFRRCRTNDGGGDDEEEGG